MVGTALVMWMGLTFAPQAVAQEMNIKLAHVAAFIALADAETSHDGLCRAQKIGNRKAEDYHGENLRKAMDAFKSATGRAYRPPPCQAIVIQQPE